MKSIIIAGIIGLATAFPASAVETPTVAVTAACDTVKVSAAGWPAGSTLRVWTKVRRGNNVLKVDKVFIGSTTATALTAPATSFYTDKFYTVNVFGPGVQTVVLSGSLTRC